MNKKQTDVKSSVSADKLSKSFLKKLNTTGKIIKIIFSSLYLSARSIFALPATKKVLLWLAIVVNIVGVVFAVMIYGFHKEDKVTRAVAKVIPYPVAIVNQDAITYTNYLAEKDYIHHFYVATRQDSSDLSGIDKELLNQLEENKLIDSQARIYKITVSNAEIDKTINDVIEQNGGEEKVSKVLSDLYGLDLQGFRKLVKVQMLREKINNELIAKVTVSHILIKVEPDAAQAKIDEAKAKIDGIKKEIDAGLSFADAAKKYSEDTGSAEKGGQLDAFAEGEMVAEFSKAAFATEVGKISEPVKTDFGWHLIKVEAKTGKIQKSFADWIASVKSKSFIFEFIKLKSPDA